MVAAIEGQAEVVDWLIENGAELNHTAKYDLSALMLAVIQGYADIVQELIQAGADINICGTGLPGFINKTALEVAIDIGHQEIIKILQTALKNKT